MPRLAGNSLAMARALRIGTALALLRRISNRVGSMFSLSGTRCRRMQFFLALSVWLFCCLAKPVAAQSDFSLQITTDRGCIEDGDDPMYGVGELIAVTFQV